MVRETVLFRKCSLELPLESVHEITHCFAKRYRGGSRASESWRILRLIFFERPDGRPEQGFRGFKAIVFPLRHEQVAHCRLHGAAGAGWRTSCVEKAEHGGRGEGVICGHMQVRITHLLSGTWRS